MTAIKFCGLSHASDIDAVNSVFPEYVGFVFWPKSRRFVSSEKAEELRELLDARIQSVGVFVDADIDSVADLVRKGIISIAQLHGHEDDEYIAELRNALGSHDIQIWKAFEVENANDVNSANESTADLVLLDGGKGEGRTFPWELLSEMKRPYGLAGGLNAENVVEAMAKASEFGKPPELIDVSSAIEPRYSKSSGSGRMSSESPAAEAPHKSRDLMAEFARKVRVDCAS